MTRIIYVTNDAESFLAHRLPFAQAARDAGFEVHIAAPDGAGLRRAASLGFSTHRYGLSRRGLNPIQEISTILDLRQLFKKLAPDIVHNVTIKAVVYGGIAARLAKVRSQVATMPGLGYVFTSTTIKGQTLQRVVRPLLRYALKHPHSVTIFENPDDAEVLTALKVAQRNRCTVIRSVGVDVNNRMLLAEPEPPITVVLAGRLLRDKGVGEYVEAARILRNRRVPVRLVLVGDVDPGNPATLEKADIQEWVREGLVEAWGWQSDMVQVYARSHVVCLPSYREGVPRVLMEAASHGRPLIATNAPGCREACIDGDNGLLVPVRNPEALADAIERLSQDAALRTEFGRNGRALMEREFAQEVVVQRTIEVYERILSELKL